VAILTFALFFLHPRWASGEVNPVLFQGTIAGIVVSLFLFVYASVCYYWFLICYWNGDSRAETYLDRAGGCVTLGLVLLVVEPAFILFTINLLNLSLIALGLWLGFLLLLIVVQRNLRPGVRAGPPAL